MMHLTDSSAMKSTLELTQKNIESTPDWVPPEQVIDFIEKVYSALHGDTKKENP